MRQEVEAAVGLDGVGGGWGADRRLQVTQQEAAGLCLSVCLEQPLLSAPLEKMWWSPVYYNAGVGKLRPGGYMQPVERFLSSQPNWKK